MNCREACQRDDGEKTSAWLNYCSTTDEWWPAVTALYQYWLSSLCSSKASRTMRTKTSIHPLSLTEPGSEAQSQTESQTYTPVTRSTLLYCNSRLQSLHFIMLYLWCFFIFLMDKHIILHLVVNMFDDIMPQTINDFFFKRKWCCGLIHRVTVKYVW